MKRCLAVLVLLWAALTSGARADLPAYGEVMQWLADFGAAGLYVQKATKALTRTLSAKSSCAPRMSSIQGTLTLG